MSVYFLVEGRRTESIIYPSWFKFLLPSYERISAVNQAEDFCYYLISGDGYPNIKHRIFNSLEDIESNPAYSNFVVILDSEEEKEEDRRREIEEVIFKHKRELEIYDLNTEVIVQHRCIETWLLGNRNIFKSNPDNNELKEYVEYYNVADNDPEKMGSFENNTHAQFHHRYLQLLLRERKIRYTKRNPKDTKKEYYLKEIISRSTEEDDHLNAFLKMISTIQSFEN